MPEASQIEYGVRELAEVLVREQGIAEGHWMLLIRFKFGAANLETGPREVGPAAIVGIESIGIQKTTPNSISVDASQIRPRGEASKKAGSGAKGRRIRQKSAAIQVP